MWVDDLMSCGKNMLEVCAGQEKAAIVSAVISAHWPYINCLLPCSLWLVWERQDKGLTLLNFTIMHRFSSTLRRAGVFKTSL